MLCTARELEKEPANVQLIGKRIATATATGIESDWNSTPVERRKASNVARGFVAWIVLGLCLCLWRLIEGQLMAVRAGHSIRLRGLIERLVGIINVYYIFNYGQIGNVASSSTHAMAATCNLPPAGCHTPYAPRLTPHAWQRDRRHLVAGTKITTQYFLICWELHYDGTQ